MSLMSVNDELESYGYTVKQMEIQMFTVGNKCEGRELGLSSYSVHVKIIWTVVN